MNGQSSKPQAILGQARGDALRWVGLIGILSIAVMRCVSVFAPHALFDTDPATDLIPLGGLAQAGSLWLDIALLLSCALALGGEWWSGRRLHSLACLFALLPLPVVLWHGAHDALNLWRGSTWAAAMVACVTIAHLVRDPRMRIIIAAILLATLAPLIVRGIGQMTWEHADTVRAFEDTKSEFFQQRGWSPDSSAARIYERRLRQPQPTGWFTTTNIVGSVMMFGMIASLGLMLGAIRARMESGWSAVMGLCAIASAAMLFLTGSKGAILAALIGVTLALAPVLIKRIACVFASRLGGVLIIALVLLTLLAVAIRGTLLPESFAGDKSLLFRWHYTIASARIAADHPWIGVGPDGFQDAYMLHRVPRNPEEVQSAHSMFWDWIATLGIPAGACWIALVFTMLHRAGLPLRMNGEQGSIETGRLNRATMWSTLTVIALGLVPALIVETGTLDPQGMLVRVVGIGLFAAMAILVAQALSHTDESLTRWFYVAAAVAVIIHGQIEMTFHQPGSVVWAMCALGLAGAGGSKALPTARSMPGVFVPLVILAAAAWLALGGAVPATRVERAMFRAANLLRPLPTDQDTQINARRLAAQELIKAHDDVNPPDPFLREAAARQLEIADWLPAAIETLHDPRMGSRSATLGLLVSLQARLASTTRSQADWQRAIEFARIATTLDPNGLAVWRQYGEVLWAAGQRDQAAAAYQRALECDANFSLDSLKQLGEEDRAMIKARIAEAARGANSAP